MAKPRSAKKGGGRKAPASPLHSDMEDEVDKFHKQRDKLALNLEEEAVSDDSLDEDEVLGLEYSDEEDTDDEIEADTHYGRREWAALGHAAYAGGARGPCRPPAAQHGG